MIGRTVGHYRILERLGGGGMGVVYKAEDTALDRMVALKFLPDDLTRDDEARQRFVIEAKAAAKIEHPNICTVHEIAESEEGQTFIAMQYVEGESLARRIARGPLPARDAVTIAIEVARGLAAAHRVGIVHRDIKPANIMLTTENDVKIVDFGVAKLSGLTITRATSSPGTLEYMAPEQLSSHPVTAATDLWSLGVVIQEMLTGTRPFHGAYDQAVAYAILNEKPQPIGDVARPDAMDAVLGKALAKDPSKRYATAEAMLADLSSLLTGGAASALQLREETVESGLFPSDRDDRGSAPAKVATDPESAHTAEPSPDRREQPVRVRWAPRAIAVTLLAVAAVVSVALWHPWRDDGRGPTAPVTIPTAAVTTGAHEVAVARFENRTQDPSLDALGDMVVDTLTRGREGLPNVTIVPFAEPDGGGQPRRSSLRIAGASYLSGNQLRLQAQLLQSDGTLLFTVAPVTGLRPEISTLLEALRQEVLGAVAAHFDPTLDLNVLTPPTLDAYVEWSRGMELFGLDYDGAVRHLRRAVEIDPDFFEAAQTLYWAWANRAMCDEAARYLEELRERVSHLTPFEREMLAWMQADHDGQTIEMVRSLRAMHELAPDLAWVTFVLGQNELRLNRTQTAIGLLREAGTGWFGYGPSNSRWWPRAFLMMALHMNGDYEEALEVAERGIREFPDNLMFHSGKASNLAALGRRKELDVLIEDACVVNARLSTPATVMLAAASELRAHGHFEDSARVAQKAVQWCKTQPSETILASDLVSALVLAGRAEEARAVATRRLADNPTDWKAIAQAGAVAARLGDRDEALRLAARLTEAVPLCIPGEASCRRSAIAAQLGDRDEAMRLLRQAFAEGYRLDFNLHRDIDLEPLWDDPEFIELLQPNG
jgi:tetratricopeptide (TPR) repeat protein/predicted Ser/Thr protein kinase